MLAFWLDEDENDEEICCLVNNHLSKDGRKKNQANWFIDVSFG